MTEQRSSIAASPDRLAFLWLGLAALLSLFSTGRWIIPLAVWLAPVFWLRFIRTQKPIRGYLLAVIASSVPAYFALQGMVPVPPIAYVLTIVVGGLTGVLPYLADRLIAPRIRGFVSTLVFPLASTALEYLTSLAQPFGTWGATAYTQVDNLPLIQIASITGIWGITFLLAWSASVVNWAWGRQFEWESVRAGVGFYAGLLAIVLLFGGARLALFPPTSDTVRIAAITSPLYDDLWQELGPVVARGGDVSGVDWESLLVKAAAVYDDLFERTEQAARAGARIVFWSEASAVVLKEDEAALMDRGLESARRAQIYLGMTLATILHRDPSLLPESKMFENKVVLVDPSGRLAWEYLKTILVPGPEERISVGGDDKIPTINTPYGRIASAICFDMDFPDLPRQAGKAGADLMFVPSGDWKDIDPYHTHMAIFRAIENGFSLVRPARDGLSAAADYQGRVLAAMDHFTTEDRVMIAHVPVKGVTTIYSHVGDVFAWLCIAGFVAILGWVVAGRRKAA